MANENTPDTPKNVPKTPANASEQTPTVPKLAPLRTSSRRKGHHESGRSNRSRVGGTAARDAKSVQPKPVSTSNNPNQQQMEGLNRDMRRRMQHLGTGPYSQEKRMETLQGRRKKRKQRLEEQRQQVRKSMPGGKITIGRKNTYFLIGVVVLIVLLIVLFVVLRQLHILG